MLLFSTGGLTDAGLGRCWEARGFQAEKMLSVKAYGQECHRGLCKEQSE